jgi:tetratricopeptide (TPR) repeat protein
MGITKKHAASLAAACSLLLLPLAAQADSVPYNSQCVPSERQTAALQCPAGAKALAGKGTGRAPVSRVATGGRAEKAQKRPGRQKGPGVSDAVVMEARTAGIKQNRQQRVQRIIMQEIELTKRLIRNTRRGDRQMATRRLRLAQNFEDLVQASRATVRELDEPIFEARQSGNKRQVRALVRQQNEREKGVSRFRGEAIKQYAAVVRDHRDYKNRDEVLFRLAFMIEEQATDDRLRNERDNRPVPTQNEKSLRQQARRVYRELIKNYPNSRYIPNAFLSFAEYYFQEGEMQNALEFYRRVAQFEESEVFGYAVYKMGWVFINLQQDREAVDQFVRVIQFAESHPDARIAGPLARQARREIIGPFSRAFPPTRAWDFFQRIGGDESLNMMERLAEHYYNQGMWSEATTAYRILMAENERSHRLCFYQTRVAESSRRGRPKNEQVLELRRTTDLMRTFLEGEHPAENETECRQVVAQMIMEVATNWHQEAVGSDSAPGTNDEVTMDMASQLYGLAIENFSDMDSINFEGWDAESRPTQYRVSYWAAELLWKRNQWAECGPAFDRVVELNPQGEYVREAAYAAVLCYNNFYEAQHQDDRSTRAERPTKRRRGKRGVSEEEQRRADQERLQRRDFSPLEEGMLRAYTRYVCYISDSDDLVRIKYRRARIHYVANHWEEAAALFREIAYDHSEDELAPYAANQYLDCLNAISQIHQDRRVHCSGEMAESVEAFLGNRNLVRDQDFRDQITQLQCGILWKQADAHSEADEFREAADLYVRIYTEYRDECREIGDHDLCEVLYNAAINYEADYRIGPAIQIRRRLINDCGDDSDFAKTNGSASRWAKKALYQIGGNYHAIAAYTKAAEFYEDFARRYAGEDEAPDALRNATVFRLGLGQDKKAIGNSRMFEKNYGRRREFKTQTATVVFSIGTIYMRNKNWRAGEKHYRSFLKKYGRSASSDEVIQGRTQLGLSLWNQGSKQRNNAVKEFRKAAATADRGRGEGETLAVRLDRYKGMVTPSGSDEESRQADTNARVLRMVDAVAKARFYVGEDAYGDFREIDFPGFKAERRVPGKIRNWWSKKQGRAKAQEWERQLRFLPPEDRRNQIGSVQFQYWVEKSFVDWLSRKETARNRAEKLYLAAVEEDVPQWEIAAAARVGDMYQSFMQALYDAPIDPSFANDQELVDVYRDALDQKAQPYRDRAVTAFQHCLAVATENRWFNEWSRSCEQQLNKLDPRAYPLSDELRAEGGYVYNPLAVPRIIQRLQTQAELEAEEARTAAGQQE